MSYGIDGPRSGTSAEPGAGERGSAHGSRLRGKAWLLLAVPFGLTTWAAFLYIGIRARRRRWMLWAAVYAALLAGFIALDSPTHPGSTAESIALGLVLVTWAGGGVHAIAVSSEAVQRIQGEADPALEAAKAHIARRAAGRHLLATQPGLARELGVGRPDIPGADDHGLIDVNHTTAEMLARLPGMTDSLARRTVEVRDQVGGFSSVEDLGEVLDLPPAGIDQMRDMAVFVQN